MKTPTNLGTSGRRLWRDVLAGAEPDHPGEVAVLLEACRTVDELDRLHAALAEAEPTGVGSTGQPRPNPLFDEVRRHRDTLARLVAQLAIPGQGELRGRSSASRRAQRAAESRWGVQRARAEARKEHDAS